MAGMVFDVIETNWFSMFGEANDLKQHIINEHRPIDATRVEKSEKRFGRTAELDNLSKFARFIFCEFQHMRFEHLHRLAGDVAVSD
jgi:hypothetical protein